MRRTGKKTRTIEGGMPTTHTNLEPANLEAINGDGARTENREQRTRRSLAAVLVWVAALFVLATANPFVWAERSEDRCATWSEREIAYYQPSAATVLEAVAETSTYIVDELPGEMHGVAIWGHTFLVDDAQAGTMIHESIHQLQFRTEGVLPYAARYSSDMVHGLYAGCSVREAYLAVRYERQARDVALRFPASILAVLGERNGSTVEEELWMLQRIGPTQVVAQAQEATEDADGEGQETGYHPGESVVHQMHIEDLQAAAGQGGDQP
jgi:hypothetical protein